MSSHCAHSVQWYFRLTICYYITVISVLRVNRVTVYPEKEWRFLESQYRCQLCSEISLFLKSIETTLKTPVGYFFPGMNDTSSGKCMWWSIYPFPSHLGIMSVNVEGSAAAPASYTYTWSCSLAVLFSPS